MSITTAVTPGTLTPGMYLLVNLLAGVNGANNGELRVLLLSPKATSGNLTVDTEIREGFGEEYAGTAFGAGSLGHLAAKALYSVYPTARVDFGAPTAGAGAATANVTLSGTPSANRTLVVNVAGRVMEVAWLIGETADTIKSRVIAAINARSDNMPIVASTGGVGIVTHTAKNVGNVGNDILIKYSFTQAQSGTEAVSPVGVTPLAGGTTDADFTTILAAAQGKEYHVILPCMSNADALLTTASSNAERVLTYIEAHQSGLDALLQTLIYASTTSSQANAQAAAIARNVGYAQHVYGINMMSLPCELAAEEAGARLLAIASDPAANRIGTAVWSGIKGSLDPVGDNPTTSEKEAGIGAGLSMLAYDTGGNLYRVRPVTTYTQTAGGAPDRRLMDTSGVDGTYAVARDLRTALPLEFPNAKVVKDTVPGEEPPPAGVIEERDIKAFSVSRLRSWQRNGVITKAALDAAIADGSLIVQVNPADATQVDVILPVTIVPPLAKFGLVVNRNPA